MLDSISKVRYSNWKDTVRHNACIECTDTADKAKY